MSNLQFPYGFSCTSCSQNPCTCGPIGGGADLGLKLLDPHAIKGLLQSAYLQLTTLNNEQRVDLSLEEDHVLPRPVLLLLGVGAPFDLQVVQDAVQQAVAEEFHDIEVFTSTTRFDATLSEDGYLVPSLPSCLRRGSSHVGRPLAPSRPLTFALPLLPSLPIPSSWWGGGRRGGCGRGGVAVVVGLVGVVVVAGVAVEVQMRLCMRACVQVEYYKVPQRRARWESAGDHTLPPPGVAIRLMRKCGLVLMSSVKN